VSVVAWVATLTQIEAPAKTGVLRYVRLGEQHEHILAAAGYDAEPSGSCALLMGRPVPWLDGFTAPPGDEWRSYMIALAAEARRKAAETGHEFVETDIYEFGEATREPLRALGFEAKPGPPHPDRNRIWRAETSGHAG
jgi:hypothetical protein